MRIEDVPQDQSIHDGHLRACYARDADGRFVVATSRGWEVERIANAVAVESVRAAVDQARAAVIAGRTSVLAYHMACAHMDTRLLAAHTGFWTWRIRRHLKPHVWNRLDDTVLARYAAVFGIEVARLRDDLPG